MALKEILSYKSVESLNANGEFMSSILFASNLS